MRPSRRMSSFRGCSSSRTAPCPMSFMSFTSHAMQPFSGRHAAAPAGAEFQLSERELQPTPIRLARLLRLADTLEQTPQLHIGTVTGFHSKARLEITTRLAPQLLVHAKLT